MNNQDDMNREHYLFLIFMFSAMAFIVGWVGATMNCRHKYESSAVKNGVGEWVVDKDKTVSFKWKKND